MRATKEGMKEVNSSEEDSQEFHVQDNDKIEEKIKLKEFEENERQ